MWAAGIDFVYLRWQIIHLLGHSTNRSSNSNRNSNRNRHKDRDRLRDRAKVCSVPHESALIWQFDFGQEAAISHSLSSSPALSLHSTAIGCGSMASLALRCLFAQWLKINTVSKFASHFCNCIFHRNNQNEMKTGVL